MADRRQTFCQNSSWKKYFYESFTCIEMDLCKGFLLLSLEIFVKKKRNFNVKTRMFNPWNFSKNWKFRLKLVSLVKNEIFGQHSVLTTISDHKLKFSSKLENLAKTWNFRENSKFLLKLVSLVRTRYCGRNSKFWPKIEIFVEITKFLVKLKYWPRNYWSKLKIFSNSKFSQTQNFQNVQKNWWNFFHRNVVNI